MHRSIIIFLGLVAMLMPLGTNSISNLNANAVSGYETDTYNEGYTNDFTKEDKPYKSQYSDIIKKIKCNNINANLNGVEANLGSDIPLGSIAGAESLQDDVSANGLGNGERNNGNFDLDCINNNTNLVAGGSGNVTTDNRVAEVIKLSLEAQQYSLNASQFILEGDLNNAKTQAANANFIAKTLVDIVVDIIADIFGTDTGCVSGGDTTSSCNNTSLQIQENSGNNAVAQRVLDASSSATNAANQASQLVTQYELGNPD
jgi:hypothetical protein